MTGVSLMEREPELQEMVAKLFVEGKGNKEIAEALGRGVHPDTITDYKRHPAVQRIAMRMTRERHLQITSKIDTALAERLKHADKIDTETLLKIRKEILPDRIEIADKTNSGSIIEEMWDAANEDPQLAEKMQKALEAAGPE